MHTVDLCVKSPREINVANCIKARYDAGISNLQADGSGVLEQNRTEQNRTEQIVRQSTCVSRGQEKSPSVHVSQSDTMQVSANISLKEEVSVRQIGFIERGTGKHQSNTVYHTDGLCPAEYAGQWKEAFKVVERGS